jgi:transposase-like protein
MTWKATCVMQERFRLIEADEREEGSLAELCRRFGVSRKTGYKWLTRYEEAGLEGLQDLSQAPHQHRHRRLQGLRLDQFRGSESEASFGLHARDR